MRQIFYTLTFAFGLLSCNSQTQTSTDNYSVHTKNDGTAKFEQTDSLKVETQYDQIFLDGLSEYKEPIKLIENYILINQDTVYFPEDIPLLKETIFKGYQDQKEFILRLTRVNLTSLNYNFQLLDKDKNIVEQQSGRATMPSLFFIGSEVDNDDITGGGYLSTEYRDNSHGCSFAIRIGEKDDNGRLRAKIDRYCKNNTSRNIDLEDYPTLRTE